MVHHSLSVLLLGVITTRMPPFGHPPASYKDRAAPYLESHTSKDPADNKEVGLGIPDMSGRPQCDEACQDPDAVGFGTWQDDMGKTRYEGDFVDGEFDGKGRYIKADGTTYEGDFSAGMWHGHGLYREPATLGRKYIQYTGGFEDGQFHGVGSWFDEFGSTYEGEFANGKFDGEGVVNWMTTLDKYEGEFKDGEQEGFGTLYFRNGARCKGFWKEGEQHGYGEYTHPPSGASKPGPGGTLLGGLYNGYWERGRYHGLGVYLDPIGIRYEGHWEGGRPHTHGVWSTPDGETYKGQYVTGSKVGLGCWDHNSGVKYCGEYAKDKKEGLGIWTEPNGDRYAGEWIADLRQGHGVMVYEDGTLYEGGWHKGRVHGFGVLYEPFGWFKATFWAEGRSSEGKWRKGNFKGMLSKQKGSGVNAQVKAQAAALEAELKYTLAEQAASVASADGASAVVENNENIAKVKLIKEQRKAKELDGADVDPNADYHMYQLPPNHLETVPAQSLPW